MLEVIHLVSPRAQIPNLTDATAASSWLQHSTQTTVPRNDTKAELSQKPLDWRVWVLPVISIKETFAPWRLLSIRCQNNNLVHFLNFTICLVAVVIICLLPPSMYPQHLTQWRDKWTNSDTIVLEVKMLVTQLCPTLCYPMDCSPPGSSVHGILQARILGWVAFPFSRESSWPRDGTRVSCIAGRFFTGWATCLISFIHSQFWLSIWLVLSTVFVMLTVY